MRCPELLIAEIGGVADDGMTEVPQVDADLIRATRERPRFDQRRIIAGSDNAEGSLGMPPRRIDDPVSLFRG